MKIHTLDGDVSVCEQLDIDDFNLVAKAGFRTVINNRPDLEGKDQPRSVILQAAAAAAGLQYKHIPVVPDEITDDNVADFAESIDKLDRPVLAFCRTGKRAAALWALSQAGEQAPETLMERCAAAGHDIAGLEPRLRREAS